MKILICDDDPVIRYLMTIVLGRRSGHDVIEVPDAGDVVAVAREHQPNVIVLDYMMPTRSGAEVASDLQSDPTVADIPIVFLTGRSDVAEESLDAIGVAGLIEKPFDTSTLPARLQAYADQAASKRVQPVAATPDSTML